jgi:hypothetical protein
VEIEEFNHRFSCVGICVCEFDRDLDAEIYPL